jgi:hypothetical protein
MIHHRTEVETLVHSLIGTRFAIGLCGTCLMMAMCDISVECRAIAALPAGLQWLLQYLERQSCVHCHHACMFSLGPCVAQDFA